MTDAESQLERELDGAPRGDRPGRGHRVTYTLPVVLVVSVIGGAAAYAITAITLKLGMAHTWAYVGSGLVIAAFAWGFTGLHRGLVTTSDRLVDVAVSAIAGSSVLGVIRPPPLLQLFPRTAEAARAHGIDGAPLLIDVMAWSAVAACVGVAASTLVRLVAKPRP